MSSKLKYIRGDLFSAPHNAILVHACNTRGSWGAGIALAFKERFPAQYEEYRAHCKTYGPSLIGTCLLLPATEDAPSIACLFTSRAYGRQKDTPPEILNATGYAVKNLLEQNTDNRPLHACRFNSGKFGVPWYDTEGVLRELGVEMTIYTPE